MKKKLTLLIIGILCCLILAFLVRPYLSLERLKTESDYLQLMVEHHYSYSVLLYVLLYIVTTLLFLPFIALLNVVSGFLFGTWAGAVYSDIGATIGSTFAFLLVRYFLGSHLQERYQQQMARFNNAMKEGQISYLLAIHFIAIIPFPLINLLAALTRVPLWTFIWTTAVGIFPGAVVYAFAGRQLTTIHSLRDIFSFNIIVAFIALALLALLPLIIKWFVVRKIMP